MDASASKAYRRSPLGTKQHPLKPSSGHYSRHVMALRGSVHHNLGGASYTSNTTFMHGASASLHIVGERRTHVNGIYIYPSRRSISVHRTSITHNHSQEPGTLARCSFARMLAYRQTIYYNPIDDSIDFVRVPSYFVGIKEDHKNRHHQRRVSFSKRRENMGTALQYVLPRVQSSIQRHR